MVALSVLLAGLAAAVAEGWSSPEPAHLHLDSGLLVSTRTSVRACLEFAGSAGPDRREAALARVGDGLDEVRRHPDWDAAGLGSAPPSVSPGCPGHGVPSVGGDEAARPSSARPSESGPSPYRLWIYVLDGVAADRVLGAGVPAGRAAAEILDGAEVSTAVLVRDSSLSDAGLVRRLLTSALGLSTEATGGSGGDSDDSGDSGGDSGGTGGEAGGTK